MNYFAWIVSFSLILCAHAEKIRIACIGDSITFGSGINNKNETYPAVLQTLLGEKYEVKNFGNPGRGIIKSSKRGNGQRAFIFQKEHEAALAFNPHFVICNLGINDIMAVREGKVKEFVPDYIELIEQYKKLPAKPTVFIWTKLSPLFPQHRCINWEEPFILRNHLKEVYRKSGALPLNMFDPLVGRSDIMSSDGIHPNSNGAKVIAEQTFKAISPYLDGNFGGLSLPWIFADYMVFQRNSPIKIFGNADRGDEVEIVFNGKKQKATADIHGKWQVQFQAMSTGGPYSFTVSSNKKSMTFMDVLIGDIWLSAGQSNMEWSLSKCQSGSSEIPRALNNKIRILNRKKAFHTLTWGPQQLAMSNEEKFLTGSWQKLSPESAKDFSGVAYYFAKNIQGKTNVPIGIINIAVGGAPIESFISEESLRSHELLKKSVMTNKVWTDNENYAEWCRQRGSQNLSVWRKSKNFPMPGHPFKPSFIYDAAINELKDFSIKGFIWYQGESNATANNTQVAINPEECRAGIETLIKDFRTLWGRDMPFYFVQLPNMNRNWMAFRQVQLEVSKSINECAMAVTMDLGNPRDVHPTNKQPVGERLAKLALARAYKMNIQFSGPEIISAVQKRDYIELHFNHSYDGLKLNPSPEISPFEIGDSINGFRSIKPELKDGKVILYATGSEVRYNWVQNPQTNLFNSQGLPASPFNVKVIKTPATTIPVPVKRHSWWMPRHDGKLKEVRDRGNEAKIVFIGDSITHAWEQAFQWKDGREVWNKEFKEKFGAINLGYSGDRTEHVLWRLNNGELENLSPKLFILLIGTNNISNGDSPEEIFLGIQEICKILKMKSTASKILLLGILPRQTAKGQKLIEMSNKIHFVNRYLRNYSLEKENIDFFDLSPVFNDVEGYLKKEQLMPDGLHPNLDGYKAWHEQMIKRIKELLPDL